MIKFQLFEHYFLWISPSFSLLALLEKFFRAHCGVMVSSPGKFMTIPSKIAHVEEVRHRHLWVSPKRGVIDPKSSSIFINIPSHHPFSWDFPWNHPWLGTCQLAPSDDGHPPGGCGFSSKRPGADQPNLHHLGGDPVSGQLEQIVYLICSWEKHGKSMEIYGNIMRNPWKIMGNSWEHHGKSMEIYGNIMGTSCESHGYWIWETTYPPPAFIGIILKSWGTWFQALRTARGLRINAETLFLL